MSRLAEVGDEGAVGPPTPGGSAPRGVAAAGAEVLAEIAVDLTGAELAADGGCEKNVTR